MIISASSSNLPHGVSTDKDPRAHPASPAHPPAGSVSRIRARVNDDRDLSHPHNKNKQPLPQSFGLAIGLDIQSPIKTQTGQSKLVPVSEYRLIDAKAKSSPLEITINPAANSASRGAVRGKLVDSVANLQAQYAISTYAENRDIETRDHFQAVLGIDEYA